MGIIIKQSFKGSIYSYLGLIVGYINVGIIMPSFFLTEQIGLVQLLIAITLIFTNFSTLGFGGVINRVFPEFRNPEKKHNGFFFLIVLVAFAGFILSLIAFFILKPKIIESNIERSPLLVEYISLLIPLFFFRIIFLLLDNYNRILYDAVTGTFWNDFVHKCINLILILLFAFKLITFREFMYGFTFSLSLPAIPLIIVFIKRGEFNLKPNFQFLKKPLVREMLIVSAFGLINGLSGTLTNNIDKLMINQYLSLDQVGIFSVCALFATVILIPSRATIKISTGIIAQAWKNKNLHHIQEIYSKASLNQTIIGVLIFAGIMVNLDYIFSLLPDVYKQGKWVLIIYALGTLVRVSATTGGNIIVTSKYYRVLTYIIIVQVIFTVAMHMTFIPVLGIVGAATAVFLTYVFRTLAVVTFLKIKSGFFCYSYRHLGILLIASIAVAVNYLIPTTGSLIINIIIKSITVSVIYIFLILTFRVSDDMNKLWEVALKNLKRML